MMPHWDSTLGTRSRTRARHRTHSPVASDAAANWLLIQDVRFRAFDAVLVEKVVVSAGHQALEDSRLIGVTPVEASVLPDGLSNEEAPEDEVAGTQPPPAGALDTDMPQAQQPASADVSGLLWVPAPLMDPPLSL